MKTLWPLVCALFAGFPAAFAAADLAADKSRPSRSDIVETFSSVAFSADAGEDWGRTRRWADGVGIAISGPFAAEDATKVAHTRDLIRRVTQRYMPVYFSPLSDKEKDDTRIHVVFSKRLEFDVQRRAAFEDYGFSNGGYRTFGDSADCRVSLLPKDVSGIEFAVVQVAVELDEDGRAHCITKKLVQAMGFPGERADAGQSVFDATRRVKPTLQDRALLWLLYHPEMSPGLDRVKARRRVNDLLVREGLK